MWIYFEIELTERAPTEGSIETKAVPWLFAVNFRMKFWSRDHNTWLYFESEFGWIATIRWFSIEFYLAAIHRPATELDPVVWDSGHSDQWVSTWKENIWNQ